MSKLLIGVVAVVFCCPLLALPPAEAQTPSQPAASDADLARAILKEGFDSHDYEVRMQAITAAGMVGRNEALLAQLADSLHDKNVDVRLATVHALADLHSPRSKAWLRHALDDKTPEVSFAAAKLLAGMQDPAGTSALTEVYEDKRKTSSNMLRKQQRSTFDEFHSLPSAMTFVIGKGIGYVPLPGVGEGFTAITMLLKDPKISDRANALLILRRTKNLESQSLLRKALQDDDWSVRAMAAQMIAHTAQTDLLDSLPPLFKDDNHKVRFRAAGAYLHLLPMAR
jgi:HEAT repeat protein